MSELDKLEKWLKENGYTYERMDNYPKLFLEQFDHHQIIVYDEKHNRLWDCICQYGSYGYDDGLLELMGDIVDEEKCGDIVEGWLTADEVIKREITVRGDL